MSATGRRGSQTSQEISAGSCSLPEPNFTVRVRENDNGMLLWLQQQRAKMLEKRNCQGRRRRRSFDASLLQDFSYDEKLWNTSQETVPDTDMDGTDSELERRRLVSFRSHNDPNWKSILDLHSR